MNVRLVSITPDPEAIIAYIARVSNPDNQENPNYAKLIKYLIKNAHFSPFEHSYMTVEIKTSRAIATQILRHRSFTFQEFSQRYSEVTEFEPIELRRQAQKNRQSSEEVFDPELWESHERDDAVATIPASVEIQNFLLEAKLLYNRLISAGVAKECARFILPLTTQTTLYMTGSCRSFIHYLKLRDDHHTQKEHQLIAKEIKKLFALYYPCTFEALEELDKEQTIKQLLFDERYGK